MPNKRLRDRALNNYADFQSKGHFRDIYFGITQKCKKIAWPWCV